MSTLRLISGFAVCLMASAPPALFAQSHETPQLTIKIGNAYRVAANQTYRHVGDLDLKLDVFQNRSARGPTPTLVWIHGGNWVGGSKEASVTSFLPFLQLGWNVVNVEYRLLAVAAAPAAADDCRCALSWIAAHAAEYNIDPRRVVLSGNSAGGQLALWTGMAPAADGGECATAQSIRPAAIVNWYGFSDLAAVLDGPRANAAVGSWIGQRPDRAQLAAKLSPVTYVAPGAPPVLTIHGDADPTSPYELAQRFHRTLTEHKIPNELVTIPGGKHGGFSDAESMEIYGRIISFLERVGISQP
jgi:acetyl esterase/lipase